MLFTSTAIIMDFCFCFYIAKRRCFEFNLSFQQSYGIYKIAHEDYYDDDENSTACHNLMNYGAQLQKTLRETLISSVP